MTQENANGIFPFEDFQEARDRLLSALHRGAGFLLLTGESGSGKSTLLRDLQARLDRSRHRVLYLSHARLTASGLCRVLARLLHLQPCRSQAETTRAIAQAIRESAGRTVLWLDEAQQLEDETLAELRILAEADLGDTPLFSVLLVGMPELRERLLAPNLFPLWRRIALRVEITGLQRGELSPFLKHLFGPETVGRFEAEALPLLFEHGRGNPGLLVALTRAALAHFPETGPISADALREILEHWHLP